MVPVNRIHSDLVKFSGKYDPVYQTTIAKLRGMGGHIHVQPLVRELKDEEKECLQSLAFLEQDWREHEDDITPAEGTCKWLLQHPIYHSWKAKAPHILWIMGNPGAGKSTLKYIVRHERAALDASRHEIVVAFFIHGRGSELQKSPLGLYRTLLHQLLPHFPEHLRDLTTTYKTKTELNGKEGIKWRWSEQQLREVFSRILSTKTPKCPVTVFVDALDEMGQDCATRLIHDIGKITIQSIGSVKVCFSCRCYPILVDNTTLSIEVDQENREDIRKLVNMHGGIKQLAEPDRDLLKEIIVKKANGIFQWVSLVLEQVSQFRKRRKTAQQIINKIHQVPDKLESLYESLLQGSDPEDLPQTIKLFQWILFSFRPLSLLEIRDAFAIDAQMTYKSMDGCKHGEHFSEVEEDLKIIIRDLSKGLVEVAVNEDYHEVCVQFIHQSVPDYLFDRDLEVLEKTSGSTTSHRGRGHFQLSRSCIKYLLLQEFEDLDYSPPPLWRAFYPSFPLADYANRYWIFHLMKVEAQQIPQSDLLELLPWRETDKNLHFRFLPREIPAALLSSARPWIEELEDEEAQAKSAIKFWQERDFKTHELILTFRKAWKSIQNSSCTRLVHILSLAGIRSALQEMGSLDRTIYNCEDDKGFAAMNMALAGRHEQIVEDIIGFAKSSILALEPARSIVSAIYTSSALRMGHLVEVLRNAAPESYQIAALYYHFAQEHEGTLSGNWLQLI